MMKLAQVVTLTYVYDDQYMIDLTINSGVIEVWLWKKGIGIKDYLFGVFTKDTSYEQALEMAEHCIENDNYIEFYESEYVYC